MNKDLILQYFVEYLSQQISLKLMSFQLFEKDGHADITMNLDQGGTEVSFSGSGVGLVDSGFNALMAKYSSEYPSLKTIGLSDLYFQVDHKASAGLSVKSKTKMKLEFRNDSKNRTFFSERTTSMGFTGISVLVKAFEFYINCELLFKRLKFLIKDAEDRNRSDVASKYKYNLSKVVEVTSYENIT